MIIVTIVTIVIITTTKVKLNFNQSIVCLFNLAIVEHPKS